jgi:hypothetical protein
MRRAAAADAGVTGAAAQVGGQCRVKQPLAAVKIRVAGQRRPRLDLETQTPDPDSGFGAMGAGEAGCIGTPAAAVNAAERRPIDMPLTPGAVWRTLGSPGRLARLPAPPVRLPGSGP